MVLPHACVMIFQLSLAIIANYLGDIQSNNIQHFPCVYIRLFILDMDLPTPHMAMRIYVFACFSRTNYLASRFPFTTIFTILFLIYVPIEFILHAFLNVNISFVSCNLLIFLTFDDLQLIR